MQCRLTDLSRFVRPVALLVASLSSGFGLMPVEALAAGNAEPETTVERRRSDARTDPEVDPPIDLVLSYTADVWHNAGGAKDGWRYLDNMDLTAEIDLERLAGWHGARAFGYLLHSNGKSLSELTGDAQFASNLETGTRALHLSEAWIEQDLAPGVSFRAGLYDLNAEFDALESSSLFVGTAHGIGTDLGLSGRNGPSTSPVTGLALRLQAQVAPALTLRAAVLDGVPGNPDRPGRTSIRLGNGDGALLVAEADWTCGPLRILAGGWGYTRRLPRHDGLGSAASHGAYLRAEAVIAGDDDRVLSAFARVGMASGRANMFGTFVSGGLRLDLGEAWQFGAAVAQARTSADWRRGIPSTRAETAIEVTGAHALTSWLSIQPDVQYVIDPGAAPDVEDALVTGVRVTFSL